MGYLSLREHTVPGILYFITLVTLLGEILNFKKIFQNLQVWFNLFFPIYEGYQVVFRGVEVDVILGMIRI